MKALDILNNDNIFDESYVSENNYQKLINEAIAELKALENRSCDSCKHWNDNCINLSVNTTGFCMYYGICNGDFEEDMKNVFCCKKWESKNEILSNL